MSQNILKIYPDEVNSGLELNLATARLEYQSKILSAKHNLAIASETHPLLFPITTVLCSTGWNLNDDYLDPNEVWAARATPSNTPFNLGHEQTDIIGHVTTSKAVDWEMEKVINHLQEKYHLITTAVLYKYWSNAARQERINEIFSEIAEGKWFVSMEAVFHGFDYAVIKPDDSFVILERNSTTAFLTKHLRAYGGTGTYQNHKLGRLLRNMVFSGKGLVAEPANPNSIILNNDKVFSNLGYISSNKVTFLESLMSDKVLDELKIELSKANTDKGKLEIRIAELDKLSADLASTKAELESEIKDLREQVSNAETAWKKLNEENTKLKTELNSMKAVQIKQSRIATLVKEILVSHDEAEELVESLAALSDEAFAGYVSKTQKQLKKRKVIADKVLDDVKPNPDPALATSGVNNDVEDIRTAIAKYLSDKE